MGISDPTLPAVSHLTGDGASAVLCAAVDRAGGTLHDCHVSQIQYRPGREIVVRYRCDITWPDGRQPRDTLLAATNRQGHLPGAIPVQSETDTGPLGVSVWRWPFDPVLPGLATAVTGVALAAAVRALGVDIGSGSPALDVVAYRPTERAVVRLRAATGEVLYVKVVPPPTLGGLAARHQLLTGAGLPVPEVVAADDSAGLLLLRELPGATLRDRIKEGLPGWPQASEILRLHDRLSSTPVEGLERIPSRLEDAIGHAELLRTVAPEHSNVLSHIIEEVRTHLAEAESRPAAVVHGDLHEAQLIVADGAITGLLDIDDLGIGDPVTDLATLVGHLRFRALVSDAPEPASVLADYAERLRHAFGRRVPARSLDVTIAAVLVGLATGPFRIQRTGWRDEIRVVLEDAARLAGAVPAADAADEELLRPTSRPAQHRAAR